MSEKEETLKNLKSKLEKLKKAAEIAGRSTPEEVARAQMYYHEHDGQWPTDISPETREVAEAMMKFSAMVMEVV